MELVDMEMQYLGDYDRDAAGAVVRIRASLQARLEGRNEGGDTEVMRLVDEIVSKEFFERITREGWE